MFRGDALRKSIYPGLERFPVARIKSVLGNDLDGVRGLVKGLGRQVAIDGPRPVSLV